MRLPSLCADTRFAPERCQRCGFDLRTAPQCSADPGVVRLQQSLLTHRVGSVVPLPGIGALQWPVAVAFFDVLLGMVWNSPKSRFRHQLFARVRRDMGLIADPGDGHYEGLLILTWLLDQWPQHLRIALATLQVPSPHQPLDKWPRLPVEVSCSIEKIFIDAWLDDNRNAHRSFWRDWINTLPQTGEQLRALAMQDRSPSRRVRLRALADVRDGTPIECAAASAGVFPKTLCRWLKRGAQGGLEAALERHQGKLTSRQARAIGNWIANASADEPRWPSHRVQNEVLRRFGLQIRQHIAIRLLRAHGPWPAQRRGPSRSPTPCTRPISRD
jgi:hypothetical protein